VAAIVPAVDIVAKTVTVTPPGGLFEELDDDEPDGEEDASRGEARADAD
jgi:16S rRNA processing protein RimM